MSCWPSNCVRFGAGAVAGFALYGCSIDERSVSAGGSTATDSENSGSSMALNPANGAGAGTSGSAGSVGVPPATSSTAGMASTSNPVLPGACTSGQRRCVNGAPEQCMAGAWVPGAACAAPLGVCLPLTGQCVSCEPGTQRCNGTQVESCADDGAWLSLGIACSECVPRSSDCVGTTARVCSELGAWVGQACSGRQPICVPETGSCACTPTSCAARELCAASGRCEPLGPDCPAIAPTGALDQDVAITQVRFNADDSADVTLQNIGSSFISYAAGSYRLCNGSSNCRFLSEDGSVSVLRNESFTVRIPNTVASGGELAVVSNGDPEVLDVFVAWGNGTSGASYEPISNAVLRLWNPGERIAITAGDAGFVCTGDTSQALGYTSCNP